MADQLDPAMVAQISEQIRRSMGGALVQVGNDLSKLDRISKDVVSPSGGIGRLDSMFMGVSSRLLGPVGLVAGLYQVSNALSRVAADSVQTQAFSRNMGMAADNIKDFQIQMQMMGKSSEEAKAAIGSINGILNNFNTYKEQSNLSQTMFGREGGAEFLNRLNGAKDRMGQINEILETYKKGNERQKRGLADVFTGGDVDALDRLVLKTDLLSKTFQGSEADLRKYHEASVLFETNVSESWKTVAGHAIKALNDISGGAESSKTTFGTVVTFMKGEIDAFAAGIRTTVEEFNKLKAIYDAVKNAGDAPEDRKFRFWPGSAGDAYPQGDDPMGGDYTNRSKATSPWQMRGKIPSLDLRRGGTSDATDFSGMRRTQSLEEEQVGLLTDIRDEMRGVGSGGGGASGAASGGGRQGLGRRLGIDSGGESGSGGGRHASGVTPFAGKGATGAGTSVAMQAAMEQLRAEGVPEENVKHAAALLTGQAQAESSLNPNTSHDNGTGYGVYGARNDRKTKMLSWLKENGYANNSLEGQMKYMAHEAMTDKTYAASRKALMGASPETMGSATSTLTNNFERPARDNSPTRLAHANAALNGVTPAPGDAESKDGQPSAFIMHHTGGRGSPDGVRNTLAQRGLGVQYIMDRDGNIVPGGGNMRSHMKDGWGVGKGLSNRNTVGMEIIAKNDRDVTPEQVEAAKKFIAERYAKTPVYGHGQVNPGHKEADEGMSVVNAINEERAARARMDQNAGGGVWAGKVSASVDFKNVPPGVATHADTSGSPFEELRVNKTKQNDVSGGNMGAPFPGVW